MSNSGAQDWRRLGQAVADRRLDLGWPSRDAFGRSIGISGKTVGKLETATALAFSGRTLAAIERGLEWSKGSIEAVLAGGEPTLLERAAPSTPQVAPRGLRDRLIHNPSTYATAEQLWSAWVELTHEMVIIEIAYANRRNLPLDQAQRELNATLVNRQTRSQLGPWVAPWDQQQDEASPEEDAPYLRDVGAAAYQGDPEVSDPDDEVHPS